MTVMRERSILHVSLAASVAIHLLLALGVGREWSLASARLADVAPEPEEEPIRFELVESPESAATDTPPEDSPFISDRNTVSRDQAQDGPVTDRPRILDEGRSRDLRPEGAAAAAGAPSLAAVPSPPTPPVAAPEPTEPRPQTESEPGVRVEPEPVEQLQEPVPPTPPRPSAAPGAASAPGLTLFSDAEQEALERAAETGEFSYAATQHFFAEYLLALKRKVELQWHTRLITGFVGFGRQHATVDFTVEADGRIGKLRVSEQWGDTQFATVCVQSIERGAPFGPVPYDVIPNLPPYLEGIPLRIRFTFDYN